MEKGGRAVIGSRQADLEQRKQERIAREDEARRQARIASQKLYVKAGVEWTYEGIVRGFTWGAGIMLALKLFGVDL